MLTRSSPLSPERFRHEVRFAFRVLLVLSYAFGLDLWPKQVEGPIVIEHNAKLRSFLRVLHATFFLTFLVGCSIDMYIHFDPKPSTSDFVEIIYFVNTVCILAESQRTLWSHQASLKKFLNDNQKHFDSPRFVVLLILNIVYSCMDVKVMISKRSLIGLVAASSGIVVWQFQTLFVILQMQSAAILCSKLRSLELGVTHNWRNANLNRKNEIRHNTADLNRIFGTISFLMYVKVFSLLYTVLILLITSYETLPWAIVDVLVPSLQLLTLYEIARLSTRTTEMCHSTAARYLESEHFVSKKYRILRHDAYRDDLTALGVFSIHKGTFLGYLATVVTFIAVLAQFDYKLMILVNEKARVA